MLQAAYALDTYYHALHEELATNCNGLPSTPVFLVRPLLRRAMLTLFFALGLSL